MAGGDDGAAERTTPGPHGRALGEHGLARSTLDALTAPLCVLDEKGTILLVNEAWKRFARENPPCPPDFWVGANYLEVCDRAHGPDSAEAAPFAAGLRSLISGENKEFSLEYPCHVPGQPRWFFARAARFGNARTARVVITHQDVSALHEARITMKESEALYRSVLEDQTEVICRFMADGTFTYVNEVYCRLFGKLRADLIGAKWQPQAVAEDLPLIQERLAQMSPSNPVVVIENRAYSGTGEVRWMQFVNRGFYDPDGRLREIQAVGRDITARKQIEAALHATSERLALALEGADLGTWDWDLPSGKVVFNERLSGMLGYTAAEFPPHLDSWERLVHPDDLPRVRASLQDHLEGRTPSYETEHRLRHKDGGWIWVLDKGKVTERDAHGRPRRACGTHLDITHRKRTEQALRESEELHRHLFQAESDAIFLVDCATGRFMAANPAAESMYGYRREEFRDMTVDDISAEPKRSRQSIEEQELRVPLRWHRRKNGQVFPVEISGGYLESGEKRIHVAAIRDISERHRSERMVQESERKFSSLFHHSPAGIAISRLADGRFLDANDAFLRLHGYSREELLGHTSRELNLWSSDQRDEVWRRLRAQGHLDAVEIRGRRKDGESRDLLGSLELIELDGEACVLGALMDVTEHKAAQEALARSHQALRTLTGRMERTREEERRRIAREVHDELGHSFTTLKFDLAWLDRRLQEKGMDGRTALRKRITAMIRRAEADLDTARRISTDLRPAVLDTLGLGAAMEWEAKRFEARTRIPCELEVPDDAFALDAGRSTAIFRIFEEALANVARHARFATRVRVKLAAEDECLRLVVADDGRGITPEEASDPGAMGILGMRERALEFDGEVHLAGIPGKGTTVTVTLSLPSE